MSVRAAAPAVGIAEQLLAILVCIGGFALALGLFYPGVATHDALAVYDQAHAGVFGDWQPPVMGLIWVRLEPLFGDGPQALLVPTLGLYWLSLFLLFLALRRTGARTAWLVPAIGFLPPTFALTGMIWRDVVFAVFWLLAVALVLLTADRARAWRIAALVPAAALVLVGAWLRPNALFAAIPVAAYLACPFGWRWRRLLLLAVPVCLTLPASTYALNHLWLQARADHAGHSILVFDLAGISHFSGENVFPVDWTQEEFETLKSTCYNPAYWDAMWWPKCAFAMKRINRDVPPGTKLFGSTRLREAWIAAVAAHPLAYLRHRLVYFGQLLTGENLVLFDQAVSRQYRFMLIKDAPYSRFESAVLWLNRNTPLFRGLPWLALGLATGAAALRWRDGRAKAAVLALSVSAVLYTSTYLAFGIAAEYRYVYWTALSSLCAGVIVLAKWENDGRMSSSPEQGAFRWKRPSL